MDKKILLFFHNLNIEGAPTMLIQAAEILVESGYLVEALSLKNGAKKGTAWQGLRAADLSGLKRA